MEIPRCFVKSDKNFQCSIAKPRSAFYRSARSILDGLNQPCEDVQMKLLYSVSVPCLICACEVVEYSNRDKQSLHVAVNDAIRKIIDFDRWQSVEEIRESFK